MHTLYNIFSSCSIILIFTFKIIYFAILHFLEKNQYHLLEMFIQQQEFLAINVSIPNLMVTRPCAVLTVATPLIMTYMQRR